MYIVLHKHFIVYIAPGDFDADTINITFPSGQNRICVEFNITDDLIARESTESFEAEFRITSDSRFAVPGQTRISTVTILDDDGMLRLNNESL